MRRDARDEAQKDVVPRTGPRAVPHVDVGDHVDDGRESLAAPMYDHLPERLCSLLSADRYYPVVVYALPDVLRPIQANERAVQLLLKTVIGQDAVPFEFDNVSEDVPE